jgi:tripartite-type tricarboxylate transporter receptor subunit TctC
VVSRKIAIALALGALTPLAALADYPEKPIKIIVPYPPGGSTDTVTRLIGQKLSESLKQPVVVENRGGASGMIGADAVAKSAPDGYTLLMTGSGPHVINVSLFPKIPYDPVKDFSPVALTAVYPLMMVVPASSPATNVNEFITWAKANKGKVNYCSIGPGTPSHLAGELFASRAGVEMTHIPYKGSGPALVDTMAGVCSVLFDSALSSGPHVKGGKLRALGVGTKERMASWPELPTIAEAGLPEFEVYTWTALMAPAGTPKPVITKLHAEVNKVLASPDFQEKLVAQGAIPGSGSVEQLVAFTDAEIRKWGKVIHDGNIKPD